MAAAVGLIFGSIGVYSLVGAYEFNRDFQRARQTKLIDAKIDLSKAGEVMFDFRPTYKFAHGILLLLHVQEASAETGRGPEMLKGLEGEAHVVRPDGGTDLSGVIGEWEFHSRTPGVLEISRLNQFSRQDRQLALKITSGAPALAGIPQRIEAKYHICGCEQRVTIVATAFGIFCLGLSAAVGSSVFARIRKARNPGDLVSENQNADSPPPETRA
jgi:hypothetical protein